MIPLRVYLWLLWVNHFIQYGYQRENLIKEPVTIATTLTLFLTFSQLPTSVDSLVGCCLQVVRQLNSFNSDMFFWEKKSSNFILFQLNSGNILVNVLRN